MYPFVTLVVSFHPDHMFYLHICTMLSLRWFSSTLCAMAYRARVRSCAIWDIEDPPASRSHRNAGKISHQPSAPFLFRGQCCSQDLLHSCEFLLDGVDSVWGQTVKPLEHVLVAGGGSWRFGGVEVFGSFLLEGLRVFKA